jgi:hypothetical protein
VAGRWWRGRGGLEKPGKLARGSVLVEEGRRRGLHGGLGGGGGHGSRRSSGAHRGEPDSARRWEESGEGGREHLLREPKGKERGKGASELGNWRTTRRVLGVAMTFRAAVLGVRAGRRRRVARSRSVGEDPGAGRRVWPGREARGRWRDGDER